MWFKSKSYVKIPPSLQIYQIYIYFLIFQPDTSVLSTGKTQAHCLYIKYFRNNSAHKFCFCFCGVYGFPPSTKINIWAELCVINVVVVVVVSVSEPYGRAPTESDSCEIYMLRCANALPIRDVEYWYSFWPCSVERLVPNSSMSIATCWKSRNN